MKCAPFSAGVSNVRPAEREAQIAITFEARADNREGQSRFNAGRNGRKHKKTTQYQGRAIRTPILRDPGQNDK